MKFLDSWMEALILIDFFWRIIRTVGWVWKLLVDRNIKLKASSINEWKFLIKIFLQDQKAFSGPDLLRYLISLFLSSINFHKLSVCQLFKTLNFQEFTWPHQLHSQKTVNVTFKSIELETQKRHSEKTRFKLRAIKRKAMNSTASNSMSNVNSNCKSYLTWKKLKQIILVSAFCVN